MAVIKSGASSSQLTVDTASLAARVTLYDAGGTAIVPVYTGGYGAVIDTGAISGTGVFWSLRNTGSKACFVRHISWQAGYLGTAGATRTIVGLYKFSGATPTAGTAYGVEKLYTTAPTSSVTDVRGAALLTTTGASADANAIARISIPNQLTANLVGEWDLSAGGEEGRIQLATGEGLWLQCLTLGAASSYITGTVIWNER